MSFSVFPMFPVGFGFLRFILPNGKYPVDLVLIWGAIQGEDQSIISRGGYNVTWNSCLGLRGVLNATADCYML
jgi:hypothetical protein